MITVSSPATGNICSGSVDSMPEHRGKDRFLKTSFSLAIVAGCHRQFCIRNLSTLKQLGTEWVSRPTQMTGTTGSASEVRTEHKPLQLSSSTDVLSETLCENFSLEAVVKPVVHYSRASDSGHSIFLH